MSRHIQRPLAVRRVQTLKTKGFYCDGNRLYLQVSRTGSKSWVRAGKKRFMRLGSETVFSLAKPRERSKKARQLIADGVDPIDQRARPGRCRQSDS